MHETEYNARAEVVNSAIFSQGLFYAHDKRFVIFVIWHHQGCFTGTGAIDYPSTCEAILQNMYEYIIVIPYGVLLL